MSKYSSKNNSFQFGLLLFMTLGLSMGIILTTGDAPLIFSPSAQVTSYSSLAGKFCTGTASTCNSNMLHTCVDGKWDRGIDCASNGLSCENLVGFGASCQNTSGSTRVKCLEDENIWECPSDSVCVIKTQCKYGCVVGEAVPKCKPPPTTKPTIPTTNPSLPVPPLKPRAPTLPPKMPGCKPEGSSCSRSQVCCGYCNKGVCVGYSCIEKGFPCRVGGDEKCCSGKSCQKLFFSYGACR